MRTNPERSRPLNEFLYFHIKKYMSKNTEIFFVGQSIFKQVIGLIERINLKILIQKHNTDHYYNVSFDVRD